MVTLTNLPDEAVNKKGGDCSPNMSSLTCGPLPIRLIQWKGALPLLGERVNEISGP